jgi:hypothetical protein
MVRRVQAVPRKDGKVVKEHDDLISATRYAMMMLRFATPVKRKAIAAPSNLWVV